MVIGQSRLEKLAGALFGGTCYLCRGAARAVLCAGCEAELPFLPAEVCPRCALASPGGALCGRCLAEPPAFDATTAALWYRFPADTLVQALKFRGELALASCLAGLLAGRIAGEPPDVVVPVPLSAARLRGRGYNHAAEIARRLGRGRVDVALCRRTRDGRPQMELPLAERRRNVLGAFAVTRPLEGATVAVVDDVMTSGATLGELARALKDAGAERVVNWVVARTPPHD
ncbi:MAG TPA: ComF family protein [Burkholderiales bacterium]